MQTYTPGITHTISADVEMAEPTQMGCCRIRVLASAPCFIRISKDGEIATDEDFPLVANWPEYLTISQGGVKVAAYFHSLSGFVYITEIS